MSGKSTLLRCLAGQHPKSCMYPKVEAEGLRFDVDAALLSATDDPMFLEWSIADNVRIAAKDHGLPRRDFSERLAEYLDRLNSQYGWNIRAFDPLFACSTGARAFVQLARAHIHRPPLYLVDEITANLDDTKSMHFIDLLVGLVERSEVTVVLVSHSERDRTLLESRATRFRFGGKLLLTEDQDGGISCLQDPPS